MTDQWVTDYTDESITESKSCLKCIIQTKIKAVIAKL